MLLNLDTDAKKLAERFDGLPLALATAGDYIRQTANQFGDYLQMYEQSWKDMAENSDNLMEYDDRTLLLTWNLSLKQVVAQEDPEAAKMFRLMGYLGNADLWYMALISHYLPHLRYRHQERVQAGPSIP